MPFQTSMKLDRSELRRIVSNITREELLSYSLASAEKVEPATEMEFRVRDIWARVLGIPPANIGRHDSFLQIGGDSLSAIQVMTASREVGLMITVQDIFHDPRLYAVAGRTVVGRLEHERQASEPFSLIPAEKRDSVVAEVISCCAIEDLQQVENVYPCTSLQEGLMALAVKQPGSYISKNVYTLGASVEVNRFREAWERTLDLCSNLRSRIIMTGGASVQAVIREPAAWESSHASLADTLESSKGLEMQYGSRLCRYALVQEPAGSRYFVLFIHHAVFDGWSLGLILESLRAMYDDSINPPLLTPFAEFVRYTTCTDTQSAAEYWTKQLEGAQAATFPQLDHVARTETASRVFDATIAIPRLSGTSSITQATILRAAWAFVLAQYCDADDVCFGTTVSGRQAPVSGLETMAGPAIATVPVRIRVDRSTTVGDFLADVQRHASEMVAHEQYGLQNIAKLSTDAKEACDFTSLMVIQPSKLVGNVAGSSDFLAPVSDVSDAGDTFTGYFTYPLVLQAVAYEEHFQLTLMFDPSVVSEDRLRALSHHLGHVIIQFLSRPDVALAEVSVAGPWDLSQAIQRNGDAPEIVDACVHQLIEEQARRSPDKLAIHAWDAQFTYAEMNAAANRLAHHLARSGVRTGDLVHVCFEKSAWYIVAILAINKAGAAWVPLEPDHPTLRHKQIVQQTGARFALTSVMQGSKCENLVDHVIVVSQQLDKDLSVDLGGAPPDRVTEVTPDHAAYVLFTSGSTGVPKGFVLQHRAVSTSQTAIIKRLGLDKVPDLRMLQFASYVFDMSVGEILLTLLAGGQLCVPPESTRLNGIDTFIRATDTNWLFLTPAFARTLRPDDVPGVEGIILAGEAVGRDLFNLWVNRVRLVNGWGPAETCVCSTLHEFQADDSPLSIGRPVGGFCWIVDPQDPYRLAPVGCVGEVVIQGPTILREYLADEAKTKAATMTDLPNWAPKRDEAGWNRIFKSGDLCVYNSNGGIDFVTRKDTQVKIRGLRVELSEVEHHLQSVME
ncbi:acetyl-CoA synthetase-like protein, partial [Coniochaeta sp. PMI_546]